MARYQIPPDPRKSGAPQDPHAKKVVGRPRRTSPPWLWIGLGAIVTILAIAVAVLWARLLLDIPSDEIEATPTVILQTAVPTSPPPIPTVGEMVPTAAGEEAEATIQPIATQEPTPIPPGVLAIGVSATVVDTEVGLNLRADPVVAADNILALVPDGTVLEVIDGPEEAEGYVWWRLRTADGTEGWGVEEFLQAP